LLLSDLPRLTQAVIRHAKDIVCITDAGEHGPLAIVYVNDAFTQLTGFSAAEAVGRSPRMLQGPRTSRAALDRIRAAVAARKPVREQLINYAKDGHSYWLDIDIFPIVDDSGAVSHFVAIQRDVTAQKRAETSARAAEGMLALMLAGVAAGVVVLDEQGQITMANSAMSRLCGWTVAELVTGDCADRLAADDATRAAMRMMPGAAPAPAEHLSFRIRTKHGAVVDVEASAVALKHADGRELRVVTMLAADSALLLRSIPTPAAIAPASAAPAAGRLRLVPFDAIRSAFGGRWDIERTAVRGRAERIARAHLAPHDIIERVADDGLLICFAEITAEESAARALFIGAEIERTILQASAAPRAVSAEVERGVPQAAPQAAAAAPPPDIGAVAADRGMRGRRDAFANGWTTTGEKVVDAPASVAPAILARLEDSQAALEENWRRIAAHALEHSAVLLQPVRGSDGRSVPIAVASLPAGVAESLNRARTAPVIDTTADADCILLSRAAELIVGAVRTGDSPLIIVPVAYATLAGRLSGPRYFDVCQSIRDHIRRYLLIDVRAIPADAARSRLEDLLGGLRSHARGVGISLSGAETHLIDGWQAPIQIVSLEHATVHAVDGAGQKMLDHVTRMAHRHRARVLVRNLPDSADPGMLRRAGVDLLTSLPVAA